MNDLLITALLVATLFLILGSGVWIGLSLSGVAWVGMQLFSSRPAGDAMAVTIWGSSSSCCRSGEFVSDDWSSSAVWWPTGVSE